MSKPFFTVVDTFWFSKGFLVVATDVYDELPEFRSGDELVFYRPDGTTVQGKTWNMAVVLEEDEKPLPSVHDKYRTLLSFSVEGLTKADLPKGSKACLLVEHDPDAPKVEALTPEDREALEFVNDQFDENGYDLADSK